MQTFLPVKSFSLAAQCLDWKRLGNQRREALIVIRAVVGESSGWVNHPAVKMWKGYSEALIQYSVAICDEWASRGYQDTCREKFLYYSLTSEVIYPPWYEDQEELRKVVVSHQSNLVRKDPEHYRKYFPEVSDDLPYYWPV